MKNATGPDSPATVRQRMSDLFAGWLEGAGATVPRRHDGSVPFGIEISPLLALDAEELKVEVGPRDGGRGAALSALSRGRIARDARAENGYDMLHAVVMAGGSGTRFWPKSRRNRPKQLLRLTGDATMLQQTVARIAPMVPPERVWIITGADQADAVRAQLPDVPRENVVAEPCPRDTAACVGLAAQVVARADPDATMIVMPADHVIRPDEAFRATVRAAVSVIDADPSAFVTFGIKPTRPETGYGYIERGESLGAPEGIALHRVAQFREKPDLDTAERFVADGRFAWNSGIFVWRAEAILDALARAPPGTGRGPRSDRAGARHSRGSRDDRARVSVAGESARSTRRSWRRRPTSACSKSSTTGTTWATGGRLTALVPPDAQGNTTQGDVMTSETRGSIIVSDDGGLIATLGVEDLVIVQSGGATLVARKDQLDQLKDLVASLEKEGRSSVL